jgi:hypothetical protein
LDIPLGYTLQMDMHTAIGGDGNSYTIQLQYATSKTSNAVLMYNSSGLISITRFLLTPSNQ